MSENKKHMDIQLMLKVIVMTHSEQGWENCLATADKQRIFQAIFVIYIS